jgi:hypothetical protein
VSETPTAIVNRIYESWRRMEGMPEDLMHPEIEWVNPPDAAEPGTRHGAEGFRTALSSVGSAWRAIGIEVQRMEEVGDKVVALVNISYRGRESGIEISGPQGHVFTIADGKVIRFQYFNQPERALEAVGIDPG